MRVTLPYTAKDIMSAGILQFTYSDDVRIAAALADRKLPAHAELPLSAADLRAFDQRAWQHVRKSLAPDGTVLVTFAEQVLTETQPLAWILDRIDQLRQASQPTTGTTVAEPTRKPKAAQPAQAAPVIEALLLLVAPEALAQFRSHDGIADGEVYRLAKSYISQLSGLTLWQPPRRVAWDPLTKPTRAEFATITEIRAVLARSALAAVANLDATIKAATFDDAGVSRTLRLLTVYVRTLEGAHLWEINLRLTTGS
jgi:hypothetical protein